MKLRLLHYNLAHGRGNDDSPDCIRWLGPFGLGAAALRKNFRVRRLGEAALCARLEAIADLIGRHEVDIACFNEIDFNSTWSFRIDMLDFFSRRLGLDYKCRGNKLSLSFPLFHAHDGVGIISRHPTSGKYSICRANGAVRRLFGGIGYINAVAVVGSLSVRLICAHLAPGTDGESQTAEIFNEVIRDSAEPVILAGDLNARLPWHQERIGNSFDRSLDNLMQGGRMRVADELHARDSEKRYASFFSSGIGYPELIDHVLVDKQLKITSFEVLDASFSDHRPILVEVSS